MSDEAFPDMMDTHQVARYLRVKERKIYEMLKDKRIPALRVTGKWLFPKPEIDLWLQRSAGPACAPKNVRSPLVVAGSHDPLLEWCLRQVGLAMLPGTSEAGLDRLVAGEAAIAGIHLRDSATGEYNVPQVAETLGGRDIVVIEWARRSQGLVVAAGNPLAIGGLTDLVDKRVRVVLRQPGSGSYALLNTLLSDGGLDVARLDIAPQTALSETEIGLAVFEGAGDAGLAVESVARSLRLGFIPLHQERYDLIIERRAYFEPAVQALFAFTRTPEFTVKAKALGGYDLGGLGQVRWNAP
jgi:putative molybdopterin biosynthesis protein